MRLIVSFFIAVLISLALFLLMRSLIWNTATPAADQLTNLPLDEVVVRDEAPPPPISEQLPRPPSPTTLPPSAAVPSAAAPLAAPALPAVELPGVAVPAQLAGRPQTGSVLAGLVSAGTDTEAFAAGSGGFTGADLVPMASARPRYPRSAVDAGLEGWVEVIFRIRGDGYVEDVRVLDASPRGVFEDAAVHAMQQWVYVPYAEKGKPVDREATQIFEFRVEDIQPLYIWED